MLRTIGLLSLFAVGKTVNTISMKRAQQGRDSLFQRVLFVQMFSAFQAVLLFAFPPYTPLSWSPERLLYPILYGTLYIIYMVTMVLALQTGPVSLTSIICSFTSVIPILVGLLFWGDRLVIWQVVGLVLFCFSLFLFNSGDYSDAEAKKPVTLRWVVTALAAMLLGGLATTCTRRYCDLFTGYIKEYLLLANVTTAVLTIPVTAFALLRKKGTLTCNPRMLAYTTLGALAVDMANIVFMLYASAFNAAFYFPLISVLGIIGVTLASYIFLHERVSRRALIGIVVAAAALALLAIS